MKNKSVSIGRMAFKIRYKMLTYISANFKDKFKSKKYDYEGLICGYCNEEEIMDQAHCLQCVKWMDLRDGLDLSNIEDLVKFFSRMLLEKGKIDAEQNKGL